MKNTGKIFFVVHHNAEHFDKIFNPLITAWRNNSTKVVNAFNFISQHQIQLWTTLSETIFNYA